MHSLPRLFVILPVALWFLALAGAGDGRRAAAQNAEEKPTLEPYSVFVVQEEAFARCGPSTEYYRTDRLRHGQQLEVYVETDDDWLGVRPPKDSFCWVPASAVQVEKNSQIGEVNEDKTVAWIGTHLGRARRYRWQVQLAEGEAVTVIGRSERDGPDGPQLWYRIVPPSGEFRWIHRDAVVESAEELVASVRQQKTEQNRREAARQSDEENAAEPREPKAEPREPTLAEVPRVDKYARPAPAASDMTFQDGSSRRTSAPQRTSSDRLEATPASLAGASVLRGAAGAHSGEPAAAGEKIVGSGLRRQDPKAAGNDGWTFADSDNSRWPRRGRPGTVEPAAGELPLDRFAANPVRPMPAPVGNVHRASHAYPQGGESGNSGELSPAAAAAVEQLRRELQDADIGQMQLVLSRLMAQQASAAEVRPVIEAARQWAASTSDEVASVRAEMLAQRARQYHQVARRRTAPLPQPVRNRSSAVTPASAETALSVPAPAPAPAAATSPLAPIEPAANGGGSAAAGGAADSFLESGFLVQVYSARPNSPPFALTDSTGRTIAYVTPSPGVNLRTHLNSEIRVAGNQGFLQGLNTPHILVTRAVRTQP